MKILNIITLMVLFSAFSCSKSNNPSMSADVSMIDCMPDRKDIGKLDGQEGVIRLIADIFVIEAQDGTKRYGPCNLTDNYHTEGLKVKFSLILKEIKPEERWMASPSYLTKIEKINK